MEKYIANALRYENGMQYERSGQSGVLLPKVSLGFWHNFGGVDPYERSREITHYAFDHGITHFDLANNYGPPYGSAEETFGRLMDGGQTVIASNSGSPLLSMTASYEHISPVMNSSTTYWLACGSLA